MVERLRAAGYRFERPEQAHVPPTPALVEEIRALEARVGPLPLSLRGFYEVVGTVDFRQTSTQLVQWHLPERSSASDLEVLGEYNPLVVEPLDPSDAQPGWFYFAPDEYHKGELQRRRELPRRAPRPRGGLSDSGAVRRHETGEMFVSYLRETFAGGGFLGQVGGDEERSWTVPPNLELTRTLAAGRLPV